MKALPLLKQCVTQKLLRPIDRYLAEELVSLHDDEPQPEIALAIALASNATGQGHVCLNLSSVAGLPLLRDIESGRPSYLAPKLEAWTQQLKASPLVSAPGDETLNPLVLDEEGRLYLARYYHYEQRIARGIQQRLQLTTPEDPAQLATQLVQLFPPSEVQPDRQKLAAALAMLQPFSVISGGPGTGKTTTVTRILALYLMQVERPRMALVAPTGKAAARLTESIRGAKQKLTGIDKALITKIPEQASTVHRLLKPIRNSSQFQHHAENPLHLDLIIVDEASMLDVPLMAKLLSALPPHCRIILLGDRDQLASVEAGSVFSDLCNRGQAIHYSQAMQQALNTLSVDIGDVDTGEMDSGQHKGMADSVAVLTYSHRFGNDSGIGQLARAINAGDAKQAIKVCEQFDETQLQQVSREQLASKIAAHAIEHYQHYLKASSASEALNAYTGYRILCALRQGDYGLHELNQLVENGLHQAGLIDKSERYYHGRPVMVQSNDYHLQLYNGDIGICLRDPNAENRIRVFFQDAEGQLRAILPSRLPAHESAYVMTVHKSQGSEFERCLMILPDKEAPVITRELIYTGVTRAKQQIEIWCGDVEVLHQGIGKQVERESGLYSTLWG